MDMKVNRLQSVKLGFIVYLFISRGKTRVYFGVGDGEMPRRRAKPHRTRRKSDETRRETRSAGTPSRLFGWHILAYLDLFPLTIYYSFYQPGIVHCTSRTPSSRRPADLPRQRRLGMRAVLASPPALYFYHILHVRNQYSSIIPCRVFFLQ
jgi:hypothetical protein